MVFKIYTCIVITSKLNCRVHCHLSYAQMSARTCGGDIGGGAGQPLFLQGRTQWLHSHAISTCVFMCNFRIQYYVESCTIIKYVDDIKMRLGLLCLSRTNMLVVRVCVRSSGKLLSRMICPWQFVPNDIP
jgi:hypothetical protein